MARIKATINPATGRMIREFMYTWQVRNIQSGELKLLHYVFVTDRIAPPEVWQSRSDTFMNVRPEFVKDFLENGEQWYDFSEFTGDLSDVRKIDLPANLPDGLKLHVDVRLDVNLTPGKFYGADGSTHPYEWQIQRWNTLTDKWIGMGHGVADTFDEASAAGQAFFKALNI